jgi:mediator of RNA polymerase II transcription subunit 12
MLENTLTIDLLTAVIESIQRYLTIWACMQSSSVILKALFAAHQTWRTQGVQSRALLLLLEQLDNGHVLDFTSRAQLSTDIATFTHVSSSTS